MPLQGPPTVPPSRTPRPAAIGCPPEYVFPPRQRSQRHESVGERFVGDANLKERGLGVGNRRRTVQFAPTRLTESIRTTTRRQLTSTRAALCSFAVRKNRTSEPATPFTSTWSSSLPRAVASRNLPK